MSVLITGATSGIGRSAAKLFAQRGSPAIVLTGRRKDRLLEVAHEVEAAGSKCIPLNVDVRDRAAMYAAVDGLPDDFKEIDILVNNAGLARGFDTVADGNPDNWDAMIDTNCKGLMYATKAVLPGMVDRKRGHIVNIGSVAGTYAVPTANVYCASKAFVNHLSNSLRSELYNKGVRVTSVEPGNTETEYGLGRFLGDAEKAAAVYHGETAKVAMTPDDIAEVIHFCTLGVGKHVNINKIEMMPDRQGFSPFAFDRS